ncbi:MAG: DNA-3-methyladenine glycosylase 2 family protein [Thermomicrobiales bacterium]|nr:DNA-3-methyladenine glycosylase 2 family protein [Thermomicrobiales bacterium]
MDDRQIDETDAVRREPVEVVFPEDPVFSLRRTCAPVWWGRGRWPNEDWIDGRLWWVGNEDGCCMRRCVWQERPGRVLVHGDGDPATLAAWARRVLNPTPAPAEFDDPAVSTLGERHSGVGGYCAGSLWDGLVAAIVGQSVSLASAAVTEMRLAALYAEPVKHGGRAMLPLPTPEQLADSQPELPRRSGVTGKRAEALVMAGRLFATQHIPDYPTPKQQPELAARLLDLSGVGPWTVSSTMLWGIGNADAFPAGDAALLRGARALYGNPALDHRELNAASERWRPWRGMAARLIWLDLLGAPEE